MYRFCAGHLRVYHSIKETDEMIKHTEEFKQEAVRIALTSGLSRRRVASDLGVGLPTLGKWVSQYRPSDLEAAPQADLARENERPDPQGGEGYSKKGHAFLRDPAAVRFAFVENWRHIWSVATLCRVMQVSPRRYRSWRTRPIS